MGVYFEEVRHEPRITLTVFGLLLLLVGALDPLEGWVAVLTGGGVVALRAYLSHCKQRTLLAYAFGLVVVGAGGMAL